MKLLLEEKDKETTIELYMGGLKCISITCKDELIERVFDIILSSFGESIKFVKEKMRKEQKILGPKEDTECTINKQFSTNS